MQNKLFNQEAFSETWRKPWLKVPLPQPPSSPAVIRVSNNIVYLGRPKQGPKPLQLLSLPPFPGHPLPGRKSTSAVHVTAVSWLKYYFDDIPPPVIQKHFTKGLVWIECRNTRGQLGCFKAQAESRRKVIMHLAESQSWSSYYRELELLMFNYFFNNWKSYVQIRPNDILEVSARVYVPVSIVECKITRRFDVIPSGTLYPNKDEIEYLRRLVKYKDSAILVLNKPPKLPGIVSVHNSMDDLIVVTLSYEYEERSKLREQCLHLTGRTKESTSYLEWLFNDENKKKSLSEDWNDACDATYHRYCALVIGTPKQKEGLIHVPLSKVLLNDGKTERIILAHNSGLKASQEAITEYHVLGPIINGCPCIELRRHTSCKHQLRVHFTEAPGTLIVGDYKYRWFVHSKWKQSPKVDYEPTTGEAYKIKSVEGLDVQKGSVLGKVPLLHLYCREMILPNIAKFIELHSKKYRVNLELDSKSDILRFVGQMPSHMKISWNLMCSHLV